MAGVCKSVVLYCTHAYPACFAADSTITLDSGHMVVSEYGILVHHAISPVPSVANSSGEESKARTWKLFVLSVYSVEVMMSVEPAGGSGSSLRGCVLLLVDGDGQVTATSEWIPVWVYRTLWCHACSSVVYIVRIHIAHYVLGSYVAWTSGVWH